MAQREQAEEGLRLSGLSGAVRRAAALAVPAIRVR
jgi:hypothetical protein